MKVKCKEICSFMERLAPVRLAEEWDNPGLLVGSMEKEVGSVLVALDAVPEVVDEACSLNVDMIITHHPLIFKALKRVVKEDLTGALVHTLIKHDISLFSAHTNLDVAENGLNSMLASKLELVNLKGLKDYMSEKLYKLVVFVPADSTAQVRDAICSQGAGWIGNYSDCTFTASGTGTFRPLEGTHPYIGGIGKLESVDETRLETVVKEKDLKKVVAAMLEAHPYEEVAYDIYRLELDGTRYSLGLVGETGNAPDFETFTGKVKRALNTDTLRVIGNVPDTVKKAAVFCGSFDGDLKAVASAKPDVLVTGDIKYHTALEARQMGLCILDAGHFATEHIVVDNLAALISAQFPKLDIICSKVETDPIKFT